MGGKAVIVRSFARIHEANLKKQGVLALTFANPIDYELIRVDDTVDIVGLADLAPGNPGQGGRPPRRWHRRRDRHDAHHVRGAHRVVPSGISPESAGGTTAVDPPRAKPRGLERLGAAMVRHRRIVVVVWIVALVGLGAGAAAQNSVLRDVFSVPGANSQSATDVLDQRFPAQQQPQATIVIAARPGRERHRRGDPGGGRIDAGGDRQAAGRRVGQEPVRAAGTRVEGRPHRDRHRVLHGHVLRPAARRLHGPDRGGASRSRRPGSRWSSVAR